MKPLTREWVSKAEGDFAVMERESRVRRDPNYDDVCFHAQQCAEKYLKAHLCEAGLSVPRTHDLVGLLRRVLGAQPLWHAHKNDLGYLSQFSVLFRYPGQSASRRKALDARTRCRAFRKSARSALGLQP
jgi:HEPN domain-containing protein